MTPSTPPESTPPSRASYSLMLRRPALLYPPVGFVLMCCSGEQPGGWHLLFFGLVLPAVVLWATLASKRFGTQALPEVMVAYVLWIGFWTGVACLIIIGAEFWAGC